MRILVTGAAGFIGSRLTERLIARGDEVLGYDNLNDYYDPTLKDARLARLTPLPGFSFVKGSLEDREALEAAFDAFKPQRVVNLAAQAGVRYSLENPRAYASSNLVGFTHVLRVLNACARPLTCSAGLEGAPESFTVAPGGSEERTLAVGSPVASPVVAGRCAER